MLKHSGLLCQGTKLLTNSGFNQNIFDIRRYNARLKSERCHGDGSGVPQRSGGRREDDGTVPCGLAGYIIQNSCVAVSAT